MLTTYACINPQAIYYVNMETKLDYLQREAIYEDLKINARNPRSCLLKEGNRHYC